MRIENPVVELLAIKLYEHDFQGKWPPRNAQPSWLAIDEEDRETFRQIARGEADLPAAGDTGT